MKDLETEEESNEKSLKEILMEMNNKLDDKKEKSKPFRLPFGSKVGKRAAKNGWATYLIINDNKTVAFKKFPIIEETVMINGVPRTALPDEVLYYKGKPFIIQPVWGVRPFNASKNLDESIMEKNNANGWRLLLNRFESQGLKVKKSIPPWLIVAGIAILGAGAYFAFKGGLFK